MQNNPLKDKTILVTGGTGSIGSVLVKRLFSYQPKQVRVFSRDESRQYYLSEELNSPKNLRLFIGDIRDRDRLDFAFRDVDYVFHAAAMKHVSFCEYNPFEAVKTNVNGSQNIIDMALKHNVERVVAISTDKAANPGNIMGVTKLLMEKLMINANYYSGKSRTRFSCVRFGNVAWANGSVLPLWKAQAMQNNRIDLTSREMTRFIMSKQQAIDLTLKAATLSQGGEIFIFKMSSIRIEDLATLFIDKYFAEADIEIRDIGSRPGEKLHEEIYTPNGAVKYIFENDEMYILVPEIDIFDLQQLIPSYEGFNQIEGIDSYSSEHYINGDTIEGII